MTQRSTMKIAVLGIGAIGSYISAKLSQLNSVELFLLARSNFDEIQENGIVLTEAQSLEKEEKAFRQFSVFRCMQGMPTCDIVIICVKSNQIPAVLENIKCLCHSQTIVITLQNGLNFENEIASALPENTPLYSGTCWIKVSTLSKNHVRHDFGTLIKLGRYSGEINNSQALVDLFQAAGLTIELVENIIAVQLTKLALNVPFFTLSAMTGKSVAEILHDTELDVKRNILQEEIIQAADLIDAQIDVSFIEKIIIDLRKMQPVPPASREALIERMKAELPQSTGELLKFFNAKDIKLSELSGAYNSLYK